MDYVVAGFGIGAVLALLGFALWELFGSAEEPHRGWLSRAAIGSMLGALVIWAVTAVSLFSAIDDSTGSQLVLLTTLVTLIAIVAVSLWYRRAEQSLLISPSATARETRLLETPADARLLSVPGEVELSEWDTWPERAPLPETDEVLVAGSPPQVEFEPERAAEPVAILPEPDAVAQHLEDVGEEIPLVSADGADMLVAEETVPLDEDEPAESRSTPQPASETAQEPPRVPLPENVLAFRPKPPLASPRLDPASEPDTDESRGKSADSQEIVPFDESDAIENGESVAPVAEPAPPVVAAAFESPLLADIDGSSVEEGEDRYQSPLLADLEANADALEEIGLVRWKPEDRLTADQIEEPPKRRRKR